MPPLRSTDRRSIVRTPPDVFFLVLAMLLLIVGLIALTSASGLLAFTRFGDTLYFVKRQLLFGVLPGTGLFLAGYLIPLRMWKRLAVPLFLFALLLLLLVLVPGIGVSYGRAQSWFSVGGFSFQPSEFAKLAFLLYFAAWLDARRGAMRAAMFGLFPLMIAVGVLAMLIALQPDTGTMALIVVTALTVYGIAGAPMTHFFVLGGAGAVVVGAMLASAPYRIARLMTFLSPTSDPSGASYHVTQALIAIGSGGIFGVGLGSSTQKVSALPEVIGDSIFAVFAEEVGFVAITLFLVVFLGFLFRGFSIARKSEPFGRFLVIGIMSWFFFQGFFNMASMVGLLPLTGVPLPFMSYGGTALAMSLAALGLVANVSREPRPL